MRVKVISMLQPWASLAVQDFKNIETRGRNSNYRGRLFIHASTGQQYKKLPDDDPLFSFYHKLLALEQMPPIDELPRGAIIGCVDMVGSFQFTDPLPDVASIYPDSEKVWELSDQELAFGNFAPGRYGYLWENAKEFAIPIPAKGKIMIPWEFDLPDHMHIPLEGGGHATFSSSPSVKQMDAVKEMVDIARRTL